jgi:hypothetical protein
MLHIVFIWAYVGFGLEPSHVIVKSLGAPPKDKLVLISPEILASEVQSTDGVSYNVFA